MLGVGLIQQDMHTIKFQISNFLVTTYHLLFNFIACIMSDFEIIDPNAHYNKNVEGSCHVQLFD